MGCCRTAEQHAQAAKPARPPAKPTRIRTRVAVVDGYKNKLTTPTEITFQIKVGFSEKFGKKVEDQITKALRSETAFEHALAEERTTSIKVVVPPGRKVNICQRLADVTGEESGVVRGDF